MSTRPCMGGFCGRRSSCPHYDAPTNRVAPAERLCDPGADGYIEGRPVRDTAAPIETWSLPTRTLAS